MEASNMKKRVIIYIRVSTARQAEEGFSIPQQKERLEKYCAAMEWEVASTYIDEGYTGGDMERPGLQSLINAVKTGGGDIVLVDKLDRLSRSQYDTLYLIQKIFEPAGITFVSRAENLDTSTPMGKCSLGLMAVFAELERSRIKERMKDGKEGRAKSGQWHGGGTVPIGYRYNSGTLEIDEYEALQVQEVYRLFCARTPITAIVRTMNDAGYRTKYGPWTEGTVRHMVTRKTYIGKIESKGTVYEGKHPRIIDDITFARAQTIAAERESANRARQQRIYTSPLGGILYCAECGAKYHHRWRYNKKGKYGTYICYSRSMADRNMVKKIGCTNTTHRAEELEDIVYAEIEKLKQPEYIKSINSSIEDDSKRNILLQKIDAADKKINRLMDLYTLNEVDLGMIRTKIAKIDAEKKDAQLALDKLPLKQRHMDYETIMTFVNAFEECRAREDVRGINIALSEIIEQIIIDGNTLKIKWKFG